MNFAQFFDRATGGLSPRGWQSGLAEDPDSTNRFIRVPTGFGKTAGVGLAWLWHRVHRNDDCWPRRLVWCLPMRVLVEQTEAEIRCALERLGLLWDGESDHARKVGVHLLMGGADSGEWHLHPEHCAVLIGTQDMLLSRALNRGYAAGRARWPMDFGLLNQDCLWVMDEVQLMDVGLATSGQLQAFREQDSCSGKTVRPCKTWWMSATLQRAWLARSPDTQQLAKALPQTAIPPESRGGPLWEDVHKPASLETITDNRALAQRIAKAHIGAGSGRHGPTLVVLNRVDDAVDVHRALAKDTTLAGTDCRLVHSRFRPYEREVWREEFLTRAACGPNTDRIVVATQVVEAGVDISAVVLVTQLAPWPSLVQRFGRAARWGGKAQVVIADFEPKDDEAAAPYAKKPLDAAREAITYCTDVAPLHLEAFEDAHPELLPALYPYAPKHLLLRHEMDDLFDTTPDLSGADVDISRFIRAGKERDLQVFWENIAKDAVPDQKLRPMREALCAVPFLKAREWLCGKETASSKAPRLKPDKRAWVWDFLDGDWRRAERSDLYPGQTVLVAADSGGYDFATGWAPGSEAAVLPVALMQPMPDEQADSTQDNEALSAFPWWQTIAVHGAAVGREAAAIAGALDPSKRHLFDLAGRWHDAGKAHEAFQNSICEKFVGHPKRLDLAKAPSSAWLPRSQLYPDNQGRRRGSFRHELASTLGLFAVLVRHQPDHPALLGPWRWFLEAAGASSAEHTVPDQPPNALELEILALSAEEFDLLAYLVCSHHGKVRLAWHASPADQEAADTVLRIRGIRDGETLPRMALAKTDGDFAELPESVLHLAPASIGLNPITGRGWTERVQALLEHHGPFTLAYLEALLRAADQRASRQPIADALLAGDDNAHELEESHTELAQATAGGEGPAAMGAHSPQRGAEHGFRRGAGRSGHVGGGTQAPAHATRYVETTYGILSYTELAPHLARQAALLERGIESGEYDHAGLDDQLILTLHRRLCESLTPQFVGWRRVDVIVGNHTPPPFHQVALFMREYALNLAERLSASADTEDECFLESLAFAEGRLLSIHPFVDFNGRVTRLFLRLLLHRLDLPAIDLVPTEFRTPEYLKALASGDRMDWRPLTTIWRERFEQEGDR